MEWQPIETAPKDGMRILLLSEQDGVVIGCWEKTKIYARENDADFGWVLDSASGTEDDLLHYYTADGVTHWMPLPEAPAALSQDAKTTERG